MLALIAALALAAPSKAPPPNAVLQFERTPCFGGCPVYRVTVFKDGRVLFEGKRFVKTTGKATSHLSPEQLEVLAQMAKDAHFFEEPNHERQDLTDQPSAILYIHWKDRVHQVIHYGGDRTAPASLKDLEDKVDALLNTEQWVGKQG
jgi:hypothetical protein